MAFPEIGKLVDGESSLWNGCVGTIFSFFVRPGMMGAIFSFARNH